MSEIESTITLLKRALDVSHMSNKVIVENIANAETPGYSGKKVDFRKIMAEAESSPGIRISRSHPSHILPDSMVNGIEIEDSERPLRADGNNVDQDIEMTKLSENTLIYNTAAELLNRKLKMIRLAIDEGGR